MSGIYDISIIGAGAVGLATAYALVQKRPGISIAIIDKEEKESRHQTGHNSGVIHSGVYYKPGSGKAKNCIHGYRLLLDFAEKYNIDHDVCGKLIVATSEKEMPLLRHIYETGIKNGLKGLQILNKEEALEIEPHVNIHKAIKVPQTGIIHYADVAAALKKILERSNVDFFFSSPLTAVEQDNSVMVLKAGENPIKTKYLINCAGLYSDKVAKLCGVDPGCLIIPFRGEYFEIKPEKQYLINHLVYPVPNPAFPFLGVHFTRMIKGGIEAGPNAVFAFKREGYSKWHIDWSEFGESITYPGFRILAAKYWKTGLGEIWRSYNKSAFVNALQKLLPEIESEDLKTGGSGVRAQALRPDGSLVDDFLIREEKNMVHVINAPSPAATSCLSIGQTVAGKMIEQMN
jgi:L-2-hydroxyglutarate oxidase